MVQSIIYYFNISLEIRNSCSNPAKMGVCSNPAKMGVCSIPDRHYSAFKYYPIKNYSGIADLCMENVDVLFIILAVVTKRH